MSIRHTLFTRLNVSYWKLPNAKVWMDHRFALFSKYTVPSVAGQTAKDFTWLVVVDPKTPANYMDMLKAWEAEGVMKLLVTNTGMRPKFEEFAAGGDTSTHRITTRLDSDDVLHPKFIETTIKGISPRHEVINLSHGAVWEHEKRARAIYHECNMFVSRVCHPGQVFRSVIEYKHGELCKRYRTINVGTSRPMWVILVHGRNKANSTAIGKGRGIGKYVQTTALPEVLDLPIVRA